MLKKKIRFHLFSFHFNSLKVNIDCICLSETWYDSLDKSNSAVYVLEGNKSM